MEDISKMDHVDAYKEKIGIMLITNVDLLTVTLFIILLEFHKMVTAANVRINFNGTLLWKNVL